MADTLATLGLVVDDKGAIKLAESLNKLTESGKRAEQSLKGVEGASRSWAGAADRQAQAARAQAAQSGREQAKAMVEALERQFALDMARVKEGQARGFINEQEARQAGREAALAYNQGVVGVLDQAGRAGAFRGKAGQQAFTEVAGSIKNIGVESRGASIGMGVLRESMASLAARTAGASPVLGQLTSVIGSMAIGTAMMTGVLAGLAAIAFAWERITRKAREAKEEQREALEQARNLTEEQRIRALGPGGSNLDQVRRAVAELARLQGLYAAADPGTAGGLIRINLEKQMARQQEILIANAAEFNEIKSRANQDALEEEQRAGEKRTRALERAEEERLRIVRAAVDEELRLRRMGWGFTTRDSLPTLQAMQDRALLGLDLSTKSTQGPRKVVEEIVRVSDEVKRATDDLTRDLQHSMSGFFRSVFDDGVATFGELFRSVRGLFARMLADMLAETAAFKRVAASMGGALSAALGGAIPASASSVQLLGTEVGPSMGARLGALGLAGIGGFGVGSLLGGLTTNRAGGAALGGLGGAAAGAATGAAIGAVGGPIGAAAGALIGALAGVAGGFMGASRAAREHQKVLESQRDFMGDVEARALTAQGKDREAQRLRLQIQHEREVRQAQELGLDQEKIARLRQVQALERNATATERLERTIQSAFGSGVPVDLFRWQIGTDVIGNGPRRPPVPPSTTMGSGGETFIINGDIHVETDDYDGLMRGIRQSAIRDKRTGGPGFRGTI